VLVKFVAFHGSVILAVWRKSHATVVALSAVLSLVALVAEIVVVEVVPVHLFVLRACQDGVEILKNVSGFGMTVDALFDTIVYVRSLNNVL